MGVRQRVQKKLKNFFSFGKSKSSLGLVNQFPDDPNFDTTPQPFTQGYQPRPQMPINSHEQAPIVQGYVSTASSPDGYATENNPAPITQGYASYPTQYQPITGGDTNQIYQSLSLIPTEDHYQQMVPDADRGHYKTPMPDSSISNPYSSLTLSSPESEYATLTLTESDELPPYGSTAQINMAQHRWGKFQGDQQQYIGSKIPGQSIYSQLTREGEYFVDSGQVDPNYFQLSLLPSEQTMSRRMSVDSQYHAPYPEGDASPEIPEFQDASVDDLFSQFPDVPDVPDDVEIPEFPKVPTDEVHTYATQKPASAQSAKTTIYSQTPMSNEEVKQLEHLQALMDDTIERTKSAALGEIKQEETMDVMQQFSQIERSLSCEQAKNQFMQMMEEYMPKLNAAADERRASVDNKQYQSVKPLAAISEAQEQKENLTLQNETKPKVPERKSVQALKKRFEEESPNLGIKPKQ